MSEKILSNRDIRNFFKTNSKENSLKISQNKQKMSREPLFELQPSLDLESSPSPSRIEKFDSSHVHDSSHSSNENEQDSDSIPELDEITNTINEGIKPKIGPKSAKKRRKKLYGGVKKKYKKETISNNLDLGPNEFSDESSSNDGLMKSENLSEKVMDKISTDEGENKDEEEYEVEEILDYKWCLETVSFQHLC